VSTPPTSDDVSYTPPDNEHDPEGGVVFFTVYGKAEPAGSKRAFVNPKTGKAIVTDANKNAKPWKQSVALAASRVYKTALLEGPLILVVKFYELRPKSHFNSKGALNKKGRESVYPTKKPDATKLLRAVEDAMTGVVYRDDAQIVSQQVFKHYGSPARTEVFVASLIPGEDSWTNSKSIKRLTG
jgi:Holliday junction resolvase RusA-like endonuclease